MASSITQPLIFLLPLVQAACPFAKGKVRVSWGSPTPRTGLCRSEQGDSGGGTGGHGEEVGACWGWCSACSEALALSQWKIVELPGICCWKGVILCSDALVCAWQSAGFPFLALQRAGTDGEGTCAERTSGRFGAGKCRGCGSVNQHHCFLLLLFLFQLGRCWAGAVPSPCRGGRRVSELCRGAAIRTTSSFCTVSTNQALISHKPLQVTARGAELCLEAHIHVCPPLPPSEEGCRPRGAPDVG